MAQVHPTESVLANFGRVLPRLVGRYFARGRRLVKNQAPNEALHRFRIRTKRVRYTLELYADLFPEAVGASLEAFQRIQQVLGELQDQRMFAARLKQQARADPDHSGEYEALRRAAGKKQAALRKAFFRAWKKLEKSRAERTLLRRIQRASRDVRTGRQA